MHVFKCWWCEGIVAERKIHQTKTCQHISHVHKNVQIPYNCLKLYDIIFCMTVDVDMLSTWSPESKLSFDTKITQIWCRVIKILSYVLIFGPLMTLCVGSVFNSALGIRRINFAIGFMYLWVLSHRGSQRHWYHKWIQRGEGAGAIAPPREPENSTKSTYILI